jgi:hypothetical protein
MKLNRTRSLTSLQPLTRNGHNPSTVTGFWGDMSVGMRGSFTGNGKKIPISDEAKKIALWYENLHEIDPETLKEVKPTIQVPAKIKKKKACLYDLVRKWEQRSLN